MKRLKKNRLFFLIRNNIYLKSFKQLKSKNIDYVITLNFFVIVMINWFKRMQKSLKKNCVSWRKNKILSFLQIIIFLTHWFLKLMQMLFFLYYLIIFEWILMLKKTFQHLLNLFKIFNKFSNILIFVIFFSFDEIVSFFINLIFC